MRFYMSLTSNSLHAQRYPLAIIVQFTGMVLFGVILTLFVGLTTGFVAGRAGQVWLSSSPTPLALLLRQLPQCLGIVGSIVLVERIFRLPRHYSWVQPPHIQNHVAVGLACGILPLVFWLVWLASGVATATRTWNTMRPLDTAAVIVLWTLVGITEEFWARGFLLDAFRGVTTHWLTARYAMYVACVAQAVVFGAMHAANPDASILSTAIVTGFGIAFGIMRVRSASLLAPCVAHIVWNASQYLLGLPVSGIMVQPSPIATDLLVANTWITGGQFGMEASIAALFALLFWCIVSFLWLHANHTQYETTTEPIPRASTTAS